MTTHNGKRIGLANVASTWHIEDDYRGVTVSSADLKLGSTTYSQGAYQVKDLATGKRKLFYGESAWSNAARYADDLRASKR